MDPAPRVFQASHSSKSEPKRAESRNSIQMRFAAKQAIPAVWTSRDGAHRRPDSGAPTEILHSRSDRQLMI